MTSGGPHPPTSVATVLLASGQGSNAAALLASRRADAPWHPVALLADRPEAPALEVARKHGIPGRCVLPGPDHEARLTDTLAEVGAELLALAGYLRLVPSAVVARYRGRMVNVHPSLLPAFGGAGMYGRRVHEAVLSAGARVTGVTVHLLDERFDEGPILTQWPVPVHPDDTPEALAARVLCVEHALYPLAVDHLARWIRRVDPGRTAAPVGPAPPLDLTLPDLLSRRTHAGLTFP